MFARAKKDKPKHAQAAPIIDYGTYWVRDIGKPKAGTPRPMPSPGQLGK